MVKPTRFLARANNTDSLGRNTIKVVERQKSTVTMD